MWDGDGQRMGEPGPTTPSGPISPAGPVASLTPAEVAADLAVLEVIERELGDVDVALRRLDDGTYGTCERCGTGIDGSLLASAPLIRHCERCGGGAPTLFDGPADS